MKIRDKRKVYNIDTAKLILKLPNGLLGYRKNNGKLFFLFEGKLGICNEGFLYAAACNQISDEEFYGSINK